MLDGKNSLEWEHFYCIVFHAQNEVMANLANHSPFRTGQDFNKNISCSIMDSS